MRHVRKITFLASLLALLIAGYLFRGVVFELVAEIIAQPWLMAFGVGLISLAILLNAIRWYLIICSIAPVTDRRHSFGEMLKILYMTSFFANFVPLPALMEALRIQQTHSRLGIPIDDVVASVFLDRLLGVFALFTLCSLSAVVLFWGNFQIIYVALAGLVLCGAAYFTVRKTAIPEEDFTTQNSVSKTKLQQFLSVFRRCIAALKEQFSRPDRMAINMALSLSIHVLQALVIVTWAQWVMDNPPLTVHVFVAYFVATIIQFTSITPSGLTISEAGFAAAIVLIASDTSNADIATFGSLYFLFRITKIVSTVPGGLIAFWLLGNLRKTSFDKSSPPR